MSKTGKNAGQAMLKHRKPLTKTQDECAVAETSIITFRFRVKNLHGELNRMARAVNVVWNYCNSVQKHALKWDKKWPSHFDLTYLTSGSSKELGLLADTIGQICKQYVKSRKQHKRPYLRWRSRKSLGWIPFRSDAIKLDGKYFVFRKQNYAVWLSRPLPEGKIVDGGSFSQDAAGRWYINIPVEIPCTQSAPIGKFVGIDLGLKDLAVLSSGEKIEAPHIFRTFEQKLATAQRAGHKRRARKIHAKIKAQRLDFLHKASADITKKYGFIAVGNVNASQLAKTKMAKSVHDAGWSMFRNMLAYKSIRNGGKYAEINEANTTRSCSVCGSISGPQGRKGLGVRQWECADCGTIHDRDTNAAQNIARIAHDTLLEGASL